MSCNRENIVWQSKDGTWNRAFYEFWNINEDDDDFDYEWDVEYGDDFDWVSIGHATEQAAIDSWDGSNPGGHVQVEYTPANAAECDRLDEQAKKCEQVHGRSKSRGGFTRW